MLIGCASTRLAVSVDSLASPTAESKKKYVLLSDSRDIDANNLQFQEFSNYIEQVLHERGFVKQAKLQNADLAIFLSYAVSAPQTQQYSYSVPTWGQTGVSSSRTYGTVSSYGGVANFTGTTNYTPTYGVTGSTTHSGTNTTYTRSLTLTAYDAHVYLTNQKMNQIWVTSVSSTGTSEDLRLVFPYMASAMKPYLGTNTGKRINVQIPSDDPYALHLRGEPSKK